MLCVCVCCLCASASFIIVVIRSLAAPSSYESNIFLQEVQHSAAKLEKLVTGHLETLAAAVSNPLVGDGLDDERAYFQVRCKIILVCLWMCSMGWYSYMNEKIS